MWTSTVALFWSPRHWIEWFLNAFRHEKNLRGNAGKASCPPILRRIPQACQIKPLVRKFGMIKPVAACFAALVIGFSLVPRASGQAASPEPIKSSDAAQLEALAKKIDEQNAKIDTLSQQILKLEQQVSHIRPGVMIGENTSASPLPESAPATSGNTHTVERGETLTSIAKMYKVGVDELQKFNHIEDGRRLQAGQTIAIPVSPTPASAASPSPTE
jgi:LysM repeat protein